jgi:predicted nucleic acid-binding protein
MAKAMAETPVSGNMVHDLHIAALLREHGVDEIVTSDTDFHRFKGFRTRLLK